MVEPGQRAGAPANGTEAVMRAAAPLFDPCFYRAQRPDMIGSDNDLLRHYAVHGWREGSHPNSVFNTSFYLLRRPDVAGAGVEPLGHYLREGWRDGTASHPLFDTAFYSAQNPASDGVNPLVHYALHGWREGASPHALFDPAFYRAQRPHIPAGLDPFGHYTTQGWKDGAQPHPLFDPAFYLSQRPHVAAMGIEPLADYVQHGWRDGTKPHPLFDPLFYLADTPRDAWTEPLSEYCRQGWRDGRAPSPYFDVQHYRGAAGTPNEPDLLHYLRRGEADGVRPNPAFSPFFYRAMHPGMIGDGRPALEHYVLHGERNGLPASPEFRGRRYASRYLAYAAEDRPMRHFMTQGRHAGAQCPAPLQPPPDGLGLGAHLSVLRAGMETAPAMIVLLLGPMDPEARTDQLAELQAAMSPRNLAEKPGGIARCAVGSVVEHADAAAAIAWAKSLRGAQARQPVVMLSGAAFMAQGDLRRLAAAASQDAAHPMVLDRAGDVLHAGFEGTEDGRAVPRGPGADPEQPGLVIPRRGLLTPGPVLALPSAKVLAAAAPGGTSALFLGLSGAGSCYVPSARAYVLDAVIGGPPPGPVPLPAHYAPVVRPRMLFIDSIVPRAGYDAGSYYALQLMAMYQGFGYDVTFVPDAELSGDPAAVRAIRDTGIEVIQAPFAPDTAAYIAGTPDTFDVVVMSRVTCGGRHMEALAAKWPGARLVFHPGDLHHLRELRAAILDEDVELFRTAVATKRREFEIASRADVTVVVSQHELELLQDAGVGARCVWIDPEYANRPPAPYDPLTRHGVAFIGSYGHLPNVDAVRFLCEAIWPIVSAARPGIKLLVVGSNPPASFAAYASESVTIMGRVADLDGLLDTLRFTVAPLRYGAGVKMKLVSSLAAGVPVLCSALAAEGIGLDGAGLVLADGAAAFAQAVIGLYDDAERLSALSAAGHAAVTERFSAAAVRAQYRAAVGIPLAD